MRLRYILFSSILFGILLFGIVLIGPVAVSTVRAQDINFFASESGQQLSSRESLRLERFLSRVYPTIQLRRKARSYGKPILRKASYIIVTQGRKRFAVVGFSARWKEPAVNQLQVFRFDSDGPIQVWRSKPWEANYYGMKFEIVRSGYRNLILFEEGGIDEEQYGLAGIFTFTNAEQGVYLRDVTPQQPNITVHTDFSFRPLLGQGVHLLQQGDNAILVAREDTYSLVNGLTSQPTYYWKFNPKRWRFEPTTLDIPPLSASERNKN